MIIRTSQGYGVVPVSYYPALNSISSFSLFNAEGHNTQYGVRYNINADDLLHQNEYQRLRADIFVQQLGWDIPTDSLGRERDRYDQETDDSVNVHCSYGISESGLEYLLAGVRVFQLRDWRESMVTNEFHIVGMIPEWILRKLQDCYSCTDLLELTRFCVQRGRWHIPVGVSRGFNNQIGRDLAYAAVFAQAQKSGRGRALALVDVNYLKVMKRSHFTFTEIYSQQNRRQGYALTVIDLWGTIRSIKAAGDQTRAQRMLALCTPDVNDLLLA